MITHQFESLVNGIQSVVQDLVPHIEPLFDISSRPQTFLYSPALVHKTHTNKQKSNGERTNSKQERIEFR
jgi:hypothetical protein